ncbi:hypothetical protein VPH35_121602 [Triticum aestivum]
MCGATVPAGWWCSARRRLGGAPAAPGAVDPADGGGRQLQACVAGSGRPWVLRIWLLRCGERLFGGPAGLGLGTRCGSAGRKLCLGLLAGAGDGDALGCRALLEDVVEVFCLPCSCLRSVRPVVWWWLLLGHGAMASWEVCGSAEVQCVRMWCWAVLRAKACQVSNGRRRRRSRMSCHLLGGAAVESTPCTSSVPALRVKA